MTLIERLFYATTTGEWYKEELKETYGILDANLTALGNALNEEQQELYDTAVEAIKELRAEFYFGEDTPLVCDSKGNYTKPSNLRKRYYRILEAAGIEQKGLHSLRHTFATNLVNGVKQPDGTIKCLTPRQAGTCLGIIPRRLPGCIVSKEITQGLWV